MAASKLVAKVKTLGAYAFISASTEVVGHVTLMFPAANSATAYILGDDGLTDIPFAKGTPVDLYNVDLAKVKVKGTGPDVVVVIGGSQ